MEKISLNQDGISPNNMRVDEPAERGEEQSIRVLRGGDHPPSLTYWLLLAANYWVLFVGSIASSLLSRFYFMHGGSSRWVSTWVQSTGFPLLLIPIYLSPSHNNTTRPFSSFTPALFSLCLLIGLFMGLNNFLFSWGISYLSVSTSSLLLSSQLAFTLLFSVLLVNQKLSLSNVNTVVLLTLSSVLLGLDSSHDRPTGVTRAEFFMGFCAILGAAGLFSLYLPVMQLVYRRVKTYRMAMEMQVVMEAAATIFSIVGILSDGGFGEMEMESVSGFDLGRSRYWLTVGLTIVCWQLCFMGTAGMVFLTSSLNGGIFMTALMSMNVVGGVLVFGDEFGGGKAVSTVLCIWAFLTYLYADYKVKKEEVGIVGGKEMERFGNGSGEVVETV